MKYYDLGTWGLRFVFSLEGSVFPKALACALPNAILAVSLWYFLREVVPDEIFEVTESGVTVSQCWTAFNWVLGFVVSFRAGRAYSRWWEGGTLLQLARGEWFNAYSSLIAFCSQDHEKHELVHKFQHLLARLVSMMYASALLSISTGDDLDFEIIDASGVSEDQLQFLRTQSDKVEIIMQWIQRSIVNAVSNEILPIAPPVLSMAFQQLSRGIVNIQNVRKLTEFQFPFPIAQMIMALLMVQWVLTPCIAAVAMETPVWAFLVTFFPVFACWGINYIASEIEQPFGSDFNDMPLHLMQSSLNVSILSLLDSLSQHPPDMDMKWENTQRAMTLGYDHDEKKYNFSDMRSVRYVTIRDPEQLDRVKHQFCRRDQKARTKTNLKLMKSRTWASVDLSNINSLRASMHNRHDLISHWQDDIDLHERTSVVPHDHPANVQVGQEQTCSASVGDFFIPNRARHSAGNPERTLSAPSQDNDTSTPQALSISSANCAEAMPTAGSSEYRFPKEAILDLPGLNIIE